MSRPIRPTIEHVSIEDLHAGDVVYASARSLAPRRVVRTRAMGNERTNRIVGWIIEMSDTEIEWWPHGSSMWRDR